MKPGAAQLRKLPDVVFFQEGPGLRNWQWTDEGMKVINGTNILPDGSIDISNTDKFIAQAEFEARYSHFAINDGDIVLSSSGTLGKVARITADHLPLMMNTSVIRFRTKDSKIVDDGYLFAFLRSPQFQGLMRTFAVGGVQQNFGPVHLKQIEMPVPSLRQQQRIASTLSAYDALIENNRQRIQLLEQTARLLYKEWFVHLRFPGHEHVKIKNGVPEGWEKKKILDVCETVGGGTPSTKVPDYWDGDITWVVPSDVTNNDCLVLLDSGRKISERGLKRSSTKLVPPNTILMTSRASVGFFALMAKEVCTNQGFINVIPNNHDLRLYLLFNLMSRVDEIRGNAKGTTYPEISKSRFRAMDIVLPGTTLMEEFGGIANGFIEQIRCLKKQIAQLTQARDFLLPSLMNGEIQV